MAGPWFTVQPSGSDWQTLETIWLSNGPEHTQVQVQMRLALAEAPSEPTPTSNPTLALRQENPDR